MVVIVAFVVGAVFVTSAFAQEDKETSVKQSTCGQPEPICGSDTCNQECGGSCGIPSCGCS